MRRSASILVDVVAVLFVMGLLAAVAIPDRESLKPEAEQRTKLINRLERVRTAVDRYWGDHDAAYPALEDIQAMSEPNPRRTTRSGLSAHLDRIPDNPFTDQNRVAPMDAPVGTSDWVYDDDSGIFKANHSAEHRSL